MTRLLLTFALLVGCGDDDRGSDAGGDDAGMACTVPDRVCPPDQPYATAACDLTDECTYPDPGGMFTWTYRCIDGMWAGESDCMPAPGGSCPVGPLAEACRPPFSGVVTGATVTVGPSSGPFRAFDDAERVELIRGGQGASMLAFRVRVEGAGIPACVRTETTLTVDGTPMGPAMMQSLELHCGSSLTVFVIVPELCDDMVHTLGVTVGIPGVGTGESNVTFVPSPCFG